MFRSGKSKGQQVDFQRVLTDLSTAIRQNTEKLSQVMKAQDALLELVQLVAEKEQGQTIDPEELGRCSTLAAQMVQACRVEVSADSDQVTRRVEPEVDDSQLDGATVVEGPSLANEQEAINTDDDGTQRIPIVKQGQKTPTNLATMDEAPTTTERFSREELDSIRQTMKRETQHLDTTDIAEMTPRTGEERLMQEKITEDVDIGDLPVTPEADEAEEQDATGEPEQPQETVEPEVDQESKNAQEEPSQEEPEEKKAEGDVVDLEDLF